MSETASTTTSSSGGGGGGLEEGARFIGTKFEEEYVLSRDRNLRCFPQCGPVHRVRHFCGSTVGVAVGVPPGTHSHDVFVFGLFTAVGGRCPSDHGFRVGGPWEDEKTAKHEFESGSWFPAALVQMSNGQAVFSISAPQKWKLGAAVGDGVPDPHSAFVFTVVVCNRRSKTIVAVLESSVFKVNPGHIKLDGNKELRRHGSGLRKAIRPIALLHNPMDGDSPPASVTNKRSRLSPPGGPISLPITTSTATTTSNSVSLPPVAMVPPNPQVLAAAVAHFQRLLLPQAAAVHAAPATAPPPLMQVPHSPYHHHHHLHHLGGGFPPFPHMSMNPYTLPPSFPAPVPPMAPAGSVLPSSLPFLLPSRRSGPM